VFFGGLDKICTINTMYSGVPRVNRESGWIHLKVGIQCACLSVGNANAQKFTNKKFFC